ncbi:EAL domain-containing protein [Vibrio makurazakiensis]|uniref:EAL domain-containing protein n=1 Tax=Vibrio makurazakiensis TaxID=2910250 RepID=UPI003D0A609E
MYLSDHLIDQAFTNRWYTCYYQPKVVPHLEKMTGVEALFRISIPQQGVFSPAHFLERAFELGYEEKIFFIVLEQALYEIKALSPALNLAVNISKKVIENSCNLERIKELLWETSFPAHQLILELSENDEINDQLASKIQEFKMLGIKFSIDDFGVGYSNIEKVMNLNVDEVKFDKSLINNCGEKFTFLLKNLVIFCKEVGIRTVAEGVEDAETCHYVHQLGFDSYQGFYFSKPVRPDDLRGLAI